MRQTMRTRSRFARATPLPSRPGAHNYRAVGWKRFSPILIIAVAVVVFVTILLYFSLAQSHPAVGKWRAGFLILKVESNKVATVNGVLCSWSRIDQDTIRILPSMKIGDPELGTIAVVFDLTVQEGGQQAVAEVFGYPMTLNRDGTDR